MWVAILFAAGWSAFFAAAVPPERSGLQGGPRWCQATRGREPTAAWGSPPRSTSRSKSRPEPEPSMTTSLPIAGAWPELPFAEWQDTYATLHLWTQIVGKVRLALAPPINHWWQVTLYVTPRGLTTSAIPHGTRTFAVDFDFLDHALRIATSDGKIATLPLQPQPVADFYAATLAALRDLGLEVSIWGTPVEIESPIPFAQDRQHAGYAPDAAQR